MVLASYADAVLVQGPAVDRGWNTQAVDLSAHGGKTVTLRFYELVSETYTGPAIIELDDISLTVGTIRQAKDDALRVNAVDLLLYEYEFGHPETQRRPGKKTGAGEDAVDGLLVVGE